MAIAVGLDRPEIAVSVKPEGRTALGLLLSTIFSTRLNARDALQPSRNIDIARPTTVFNVTFEISPGYLVRDDSVGTGEDDLNVRGLGGLGL